MAFFQTFAYFLGWTSLHSEQLAPQYVTVLETKGMSSVLRGLQYCWKFPQEMDSWWSFLFPLIPRRMEKAMATQSSTPAWKIPWMEEPGRLQSMGSLRVGHNWAIHSLFTFMHWRRKWQPTPVFLPGESQGWGSLVGCRLWGRTESDTTEVT